MTDRNESIGVPYTATKPLDDWLEKHHARLLWTARVTEAYGVLGRHVIECWRINAAPLLVVRYNGGLEGWDVYTSHGGNDVKTTLEDAESRLLPAQTLNVEPCFACGSKAQHPRPGCTYYRTTPAELGPDGGLGRPGARDAVADNEGSDD